MPTPTLLANAKASGKWLKCAQFLAKVGLQLRDWSLFAVCRVEANVRASAQRSFASIMKIFFVDKVHITSLSLSTAN